MAGIALNLPPTIDVLGIGCASVDDLIYVAEFPASNSKAEVRLSVRDFGGLTATALVAASRLGSRCAFAGVLGNDELSQAVIDHMSDERIDVSAVLRIDAARPIHSVIVVGETHGSRNIFFELNGVVAACSGWPSDDVIRSAKVIFLDYVGLAGTVAAARIARDAGIPVVADIEGDDSPALTDLLGLVDHLILSYEFATKLTGLDDPAAMVDRLWQDDRAVVVVTKGADGCWYRDATTGTTHQPAYCVDVVDTTGCGDVFHGAYASALAKDKPVGDRIAFASAAAALKAMQRGAQSGIPTEQAVRAFQQERGA